jgi:TolB-like protein/Flp pilus assembly protein TadD
VSTLSPSIGQVFGHYRLVAQIGAGGMGVVFRAWDEKLHRDVAVKVLPAGLFSDPTSRERFRQEALALGRLNHPNIAMAFDFGDENGIDYLVSEYISGLNLDERINGQPLPQQTLLELGIQMASGLEAAHRAGVIHRDLKPGNVRLNQDGQLKILDFGLAKVMSPIEESAATATLEENLSVSGTLPYMAPELLRAQEADARADIWATGAVLYEMATGKRAFPDKQPSMVIDAILHYDPVRPTLLNPQLPPNLELVIQKALERDPECRYQSARELRGDLGGVQGGSDININLQRPISATVSPQLVGASRHQRRWFILALAVLLAIAAVGVLVWRKVTPPGGAGGIHSIAVLPFADLSPAGGGQEYFADGVTEELINDLSGIGALRVISRNSSMNYKNVHKALPEIARELNVDAVVEGMVQRSGDEVKISADLVDARQDRNLWGHSYQGDLRDVLSLESEVAQAIAGEIQVHLSAQESASLSRRQVVNPRAYETYLHALYLWNRRTPDDLRGALAEFKKAIDLDPNSALAWAGLADTYTLLVSASEMSPAQGMPLAEAAAKKALQLDNSLAQAHASLGITEWTYEWDSTRAAEEFARAVELDPSYAVAREWYGIILGHMGRFSEALDQIQRARELDPYSVRIQVNIARLYYFTNQYDTAINMLKKIKEEQPRAWEVSAILGQTYLASGRLDEAIEELERARTLAPSALRNLGVLGDAYGRAGKRENALAIAAELDGMSHSRYVSPTFSALVYMGMGDKTRTFALLDKAFGERSEWMMVLKTEPEFDPLRKDPRFQSLIQRVAESAGNAPK